MGEPRRLAGSRIDGHACRSAPAQRARMNLSLRARGGELGEGEEHVEFEFEGRKLAGRRGETLAAALAAAGIRELRLTRQGEGRGIFCGMGVCQECLVEVEGRANQRACMTKLERWVRLRRQAHLAGAAEGPGELGPPSPAATPLEPDILVIGGGAGGLNAARAAAQAGARVLLVDERPMPGGQF